VACSRRQRRGVRGESPRACGGEPAGTDGSDAVRKGRDPDEGSIVDGRRPGPARSAAFDEAAGEADLAARRTQSSALSSEGAVAVSLGSRQRAPEATSRARFAAENAATGRHGAEELPIEAPPGPRGALFDASARSSGSARARRTVVGDGRSWRVAVKRRSTRGSAGGPTTEGGSVSQPRAGPARGSPGTAHARESDGPCWVHVFVSRLQKSERGIFPPVRSARPQRAEQARG